MILMTISPWGLSKEYKVTFAAEILSLPLALPPVGLQLSMILTEVPDDVSEEYDDNDDYDDDNDDDGSP